MHTRMPTTQHTMRRIITDMARRHRTMAKGRRLTITHTTIIHTVPPRIIITVLRMGRHMGRRISTGHHRMRTTTDRRMIMELRPMPLPIPMTTRRLCMQCMVLRLEEEEEARGIMDRDVTKAQVLPGQVLVAGVGVQAAGEAGGGLVRDHEGNDYKRCSRHSFERPLQSFQISMSTHKRRSSPWSLPAAKLPSRSVAFRILPISFAHPTPTHAAAVSLATSCWLCHWQHRVGGLFGLLSALVGFGLRVRPFVCMAV